jgi:nitroimidazol reductase NimA-like FMN-containing flavoprotein (pyridoxamine 5'-phosphate oxidase superfamily)
MVPVDDSGLDELDIDECRARLRREPIGRVGIAVDAEPLVLPVNHAFRDDTVHFRTRAGSTLDRAAGRRVAFEVDGTDAEFHLGWSVIVVGTLEPVPGSEIADAERLPLAPWAAGVRSRWMRIRADRITGRSIRAHRGSMPERA